MIQHEIHFQASRTGVDSRDRVGWTPLHMASMNGRTECARALVEAGATIDAVSEVQLVCADTCARACARAC